VGVPLVNSDDFAECSREPFQHVDGASRSWVDLNVAAPGRSRFRRRHSLSKTVGNDSLVRNDISRTDTSTSWLWRSL
jgi:hypothetical protein